VRLKRFLEMRGADGGPWRMLCALPALWVGLLYESQAQAEALAYIQDWTAEEREYLRVTVSLTEDINHVVQSFYQTAVRSLLASGVQDPDLAFAVSLRMQGSARS
ncbi:hypothetical protein DUNSADRAFT_10294, partial [Dunaliella salina]